MRTIGLKADDIENVWRVIAAALQFGQLKVQAGVGGNADIVVDEGEKEGRGEWGNKAWEGV